MVGLVLCVAVIHQETSQNSLTMEHYGVLHSATEWGCIYVTLWTRYGAFHSVYSLRSGFLMNGLRG